MPDLNALLDHYLSLVEGALTPVPGKLFVQPGSEVAWDQCDCDGQGWSRLVQVTPVVQTRRANGLPCVVAWDVSLAVGVLRCVKSPTATAGGKVRLPSGADITADGHRFGDDLLALMTAIECDGSVRQITGATPLGPTGGCAGSEVQFVVRISPCCIDGAPAGSESEPGGGE